MPQVNDLSWLHTSFYTMLSFFILLMSTFYMFSSASFKVFNYNDIFSFKFMI